MSNLDQSHQEPKATDPDARRETPDSALTQGIVSVNKRNAGSDNKLGKGLFILMVGAALVGALGWFGQSWLNQKKIDMRLGAAPKVSDQQPNLFNPEKTGTSTVKPKLGSESGLPPTSLPAAVTAQTAAGQKSDDCVRPLRSADGKIMVNPQGQAIGVDCDGKVINVPAISTVGDGSGGRKPLPGQPVAQVAGVQGTGTTEPKPPSRYGGALFAGEVPKVAAVSATSAMQAQTPSSGLEAYTQALKALGITPAQLSPGSSTQLPTRAPSATPFPGQPAGVVYNPQEGSEQRPGTVGSALYTSATPIATARRMASQNLTLPKGRQADCILTSRIIDEVPGFTSCVLAQNLYSDNGRVLLLERGSELNGEYGVTNQLGNERLFVTWGRIKTPQGIVVDLGSPGTDQLGTSGLPGHLDNRWGARVAAALLISLVKDVSVAAINNQTKSTAGGTSVNIQSPGQNTANASGQLAEEIIKQTIKVRPRLSINEGDRIAIYVARDLDFSAVYALRESGNPGGARLLAP